MPPPSELPISLAVATLLLAGCGGAQVSLGTAVAEELAQRADGVAAALADGDECLALERIGGLRSATATARDADEVPDAVAAEVLTAAQRIEQDIRCEPEPPAEEQPEQDRDDEDEDDDDDGAGPGGDDEADEHPGRGRGRDNGNGPGRSDD